MWFCCVFLIAMYKLFLITEEGMVPHFLKSISSSASPKWNTSAFPRCIFLLHNFITVIQMLLWGFWWRSDKLQNPSLFFQVVERKITQPGNRKLLSHNCFCSWAHQSFLPCFSPSLQTLLALCVATIQQCKGLYKVDDCQHSAHISGVSSCLF